MPKKAAIHLISPINFIAAVSAVRTLHTRDGVVADIILHWPGIDPFILQELAAIIDRFGSKFEEVCRIKPVPQRLVDRLLALPTNRQLAEAARIVIGAEHYDEIFYPHDVVGHFFQILCEAYPAARRICYGDALGNVYQKEFHLSLLGITPSNNGRFGNYPPDVAALVLPVDQSGRFLSRTPLIVCPKPIATGVMDLCVQAVPELLDYSRRLLAGCPNGSKLLMITENIAEGGFIDFSREIQMYVALILENIDRNGVVFLKSHPGETLPRNERLCEALTGKVQVVALEKKFKRYPIELWTDLLGASKVVCLSYPTLSLKYFYGIDVINPADGAFIKKWFPDWTWDSYLDSIDLYKKPLEALPRWRGLKVLWSGGAVQESIGEVS